MKKKLLFTSLIAIISVAAFGYYLYNKPHQSIANEKPKFNLSSSDLISEFEGNENAANSKYLGSVIEVSGKISEKSIDEKGKLNITLQGGDLGGVGCVFDKNTMDKAKTLVEGHQVKIKGVCTGVLIDVVLVDCVIDDENQ